MLQIELNFNEISGFCKNLIVLPKAYLSTSGKYETDKENVIFLMS